MLPPYRDTGSKRGHLKVKNNCHFKCNGNVKSNDNSNLESAFGRVVPYSNANSGDWLANCCISQRPASPGGESVRWIR